MADNVKERIEEDRNEDPITGSPGSHPIGTGIGSASGAATGAAIGSIGGPLGAIIGGVSGAIVGGIIGHGVGEAVDPTVEEEYWRENYAARPYADPDEPYETYQPFYQYGYAARSHNFDRSWDEVEPQLRKDYDENWADEYGPWEERKVIIREGYERPRA